MKNKQREFVQTFIDPIVSNHFEGGADHATSKEFEQKLNDLVDQYYQPLNKTVEHEQPSTCDVCGKPTHGPGIFFCCRKCEETGRRLT